MKEILLAKSHFKKKRSISIAIGLIIILASFLIGISLLLILDAYGNPKKYAKKLNSGDGISIIYNDLDSLDSNVISDALRGADSYEVIDYSFFHATSITFGSGELVINVLINDSKSFNKTIDRSEIALEDTNIKNNYIYLPYQFHTSADVKIGDTYTLNLNSKRYEYKVRGFISNTYYGCNNSGFYEFILDDISYEAFRNDNSSNNSYVISFKVSEISSSRMLLQITNVIAKANSNSSVEGTTLDGVYFNRGFMALILAISFIMVSLILLIVVIFMLFNSISDFIKENMKEIGALKAMGYTTKNIVISLLLQFLILSIIGSILGVILSYIGMPLIGILIEKQQGLPYNVAFNFIAVFVPIVFIVLFTQVLVLISTRKIYKIEPIVALREGLNTYNFKKNRVPLDKGNIGLNLSLSLKTLFNNIGQNIITFFVVGFITFTCVVALLMFENFNRHPKIDMLTFETCSGVVAIDSEYKDSLYQYLEDRSDVTNVKNMINLNLIYKDNEDSVFSYIIDDINKLNNKNVCYKGRLPIYDNEIALSGKFLSDYKISVGDEIEFMYAGNKQKFLISGAIQTTNNGGREALLSFDAASRFTDLTSAPGYLWFDSDVDADIIFDDCIQIYQDHIITTMNFNKVMDAGIKNFKSIALVMLIAMLVISSLIILLVLYLLIKSLMRKKKKEYGILKALGYKTSDLVLQTAISFMPSIIISVVLFSVLSYFLANPYMNLIMVNFGIMKCSFSIPVLGVLLIGILLVLISFLFAIFESRRIKKIEPYKLLITE